MFKQILAGKLQAGDVLRGFGEVDGVKCCRKTIHVSFTVKQRRPRKFAVRSRVYVSELPDVVLHE